MCPAFGCAGAGFLLPARLVINCLMEEADMSKKDSKSKPRKQQGTIPNAPADDPIYKDARYNVVWSPIPGSRNGIPPKAGQKRKDK